MSELLPCPFCGSKAWLRDNAVGRSRIECDECQIGQLDFTDHADAIAAWNRRAVVDGVLRAAWEAGRKSYCPAGILKDTERTEREWQLAKSALAARSTVPEAGKAVVVKPLEWRFFDVKHEYGRGVWDANHSYGTFTIQDCVEKYEGDNRFYVYHLSASFATLEAAQEAVYRQYEQRILSALASVPAPSGAEPSPIRNEELGFVEFINQDVPYIVREIDGHVAILHDMETRAVIGYRVYDPAKAQAVTAEDIAGLVERLKDHYRTDVGMASQTGDDVALAAAALTSLSAEREAFLKLCEALGIAATAAAYLDGQQIKARLTASEAEATSLRTIVSECAKALGNGAYIAPTCTIEFMGNLPEEIRLVVADLRRKVEEAYEQMDAIYEECAGVAVPARDTAFEAIEAYRSTIRLLHARAADRTRRILSGASE
jgi:Lar family restriction alleviation protein